jgi:hypothetical protein
LSVSILTLQLGFVIRSAVSFRSLLSNDSADSAIVGLQNSAPPPTNGSK